MSNAHKEHWELCLSQPGTMEKPHNSEPIAQDTHKCGHRLLSILAVGIEGDTVLVSPKKSLEREPK